MISVLVTRADSRAELEAEWAIWMTAHHAPPTLILGHKDLPFAFPEQNDSAETFFNGVRVLDLDDFFLIHEDDLWPRDDDDAAPVSE